MVFYFGQGRKKAKYSVFDIFGATACIFGTAVVIGFLAYFLIIYFSNAGKNSTYLTSIVALIGALFAFDIQVVFLGKNSAKIREDRIQNTYHDYYDLQIKHGRENQETFHFLVSTFKKCNLHMIKSSDSYSIRFVISYLPEPIITEPPFCASFKPYFATMQSEYSSQPFSSTDDSSFDVKKKDPFEFLLYRLDKLADIIEKTIGIYHRGLYDEKAYKKLIAPFVDECCCFLLPYLLATKKINFYKEIAYNICQMVDGIHGR